LDDAYDVDSGNPAVIPVDTEGDGTPDYLDEDTDNDGIDDYIEGWDTNDDGTPETVATGSDTDGDGLDNAYDTVNNTTTVQDGTNNTTPQDYPDLNIPGGDRDWREYVAEPSMTLIKSAAFNDENGDGMAQVGETITYTFTVTNTGNVIIRGLTVDDAVVTVTGGPIDLDVGQTDSSTFTATYTLTQEDLDRGYVENQATVTGTAPNGDTVTAVSDAGTDADGNPIADPLNTETPDGEGLTDGDPANDPTVVKVLGIKINQVFTPNGDGINDTWVVNGITHFANRVEIYNRWGNLVYAADNYKNDWDGRANVSRVMNKGEYLPAGTYYYIIDLGEYGKFAGYLYLNK